MTVYKNIDEFLKLNNISKEIDYGRAYEFLVVSLGYKEALKVLHKYIKDKKLFECYSYDKNLNNIWHHGIRFETALPNFFKDLTLNTWEWDDIGWLIYSKQKDIKFRFISLSNLTAIAKATARLRVKELEQRGEVLTEY